MGKPKPFPPIAQVLLATLYIARNVKSVREKSAALFEIMDMSPDSTDKPDELRQLEFRWLTNLGVL